MDKLPHQMTERQYTDFIRDSYITENPDAISKAEYEREYPFGSRRGEWLSKIRQAAQGGNVIPANVLDSVFALQNGGHFVYSLMHDLPACIPSGYLVPTARQINKDAERERIAARRKGK